MKVEYINPFIESVHQLFTTMLGCSVERGTVAVSRNGGGPGDITAMIGLSGPARGLVALNFSMETARSLVGRFLHLDPNQVEDSVADGVAELVNIVAGSAKARFHETQGGGVINLSLPTVVRGSSYSVDYPSQAAWLDVPFESELGPFHMRVTFEFDRKPGATR